MTPKEKAQELIDKMYHYQWREKQRAKECALIAVDEVIEALHEHHWQNRLIIDYWKEVKQEIEKL
jgi:thymidylate synthase